MSPSRKANDWQAANTHCVSNGESLATVIEIGRLDFGEGVESGAEPRLADSAALLEVGYIGEKGLTFEASSS